MSRNRITAVALVALLVVAGAALWLVPRSADAAAVLPPDTGVRFRIATSTPAQADPTEFTDFVYVVPNRRGVQLTDLVLQNPNTDGGTMRIQIDDQVILEENLANLQNRHYPIPLRLQEGDRVVVAVSCQIPGPPNPADGECSPAVSFFG